MKLLSALISLTVLIVLNLNYILVQGQLLIILLLINILSIVSQHLMFSLMDYVKLSKETYHQLSKATGFSLIYFIATFISHRWTAMSHSIVFIFDCYRMGSPFLSMREKHFLRIVHSKVKYLFFPKEMVFI